MSDRPMWPVAPKMSHTFGLGGLVEEGGLVVAGRVTLFVDEEGGCVGEEEEW